MGSPIYIRVYSDPATTLVRALSESGKVAKKWKVDVLLLHGGKDYRISDDGTVMPEGVSRDEI